MKTALLLLATIVIGAVQDTSTYTNPDINISFTHPKTWVVEKPKNNITKIHIPIDGDWAELQIHSSVYFSESERWQEVQIDLAKAQRRELQRQWQETMIGVPLLLSRTQWKDGETEMSRMTGLLYSATRKKLLFHLTARVVDFDKAEATVREALQTMRTIDGVMPKPEDPMRDKDPKMLDLTLKNPPLIMRPQVSAKKTFVKAPVVVLVKAGGQDVSLRLPAGWTATKGAGEALTISNPKLSAPVSVTVHSTLDSATPESAILKSANDGLSAFQKVDKRLDNIVAQSGAGASVITVARIGTGTGGPLMTLEATGRTGDMYWMLKSRWTSDQAYKADMKLIATLLDEMSVDTAAP